MKRTRWGLVIALSGAALALAACGGDDDGGGDQASENADLFTTSGFREAYDAVSDEAGESAQILKVQITAGGAEFTLRSGEQATGFIYTGGELNDQEVEVVGPGSLEGQDFPISEIDPGAIDRIVSGVQEESGVGDIEVTVMTLERGPVEDALRWTVNAEGGGRTGLVYTADPDGSNLRSPLGDVTGSETEATPPGNPTPQALAQCVQSAQGDPEKIQACLE